MRSKHKTVWNRQEQSALFFYHVITDLPRTTDEVKAVMVKIKIISIQYYMLTPNLVGTFCSTSQFTAKAELGNFSVLV